MLLVRVPERERDTRERRDEREIIMRRGIAGALRSVTTMSSRPSWQQTMLRIKDPKKSLDFYEKHLGMKLVDKYDFKAWEFSLYFLVSMKPGETLGFTPGTPEAREYLWNTDKVTLELTHNWGTEKVRSTRQVKTKEFRSNKRNFRLLLLPSSFFFFFLQEDSQVYHPGNQKNDGFGHIAFSVDDVYKARYGILSA